MDLPRRTDYATRVVLALAVDDGGPLKLDEIAEATEAPRSVLEQLMPTLRTARIVRSTRGPGGGYSLIPPAEEITLQHVVSLVQGQLAPIGYAARHRPDPSPALVAGSLRPIWEEIRDATTTILERTTFADLARAAKNASSADQ